MGVGDGEQPSSEVVRLPCGKAGQLESCLFFFFLFFLPFSLQQVQCDLIVVAVGVGAGEGNFPAVVEVE